MRTKSLIWTYIFTTSGCSTYTETWAKYFESDNHEKKPCIKVVKQERHEFGVEAETETIKTYKLSGDSLKIINKEIRNNISI